MSLPSVRMKKIKKTLVISENEFNNLKKYFKKAADFRYLFLFRNEKEKIRYLCHLIKPLSQATKYFPNLIETNNQGPIFFFRNGKSKKIYNNYNESFICLSMLKN